jgi:WD40 repeat protein
MSRSLLCLILTSLSPAFAQEKETPGVEADPIPDSRVHLVRDPGGHAALPVQCVFTPDGKTLISAAEDRTVQVWDVVMAERLRVIRPPLGPDGQGGVPQHLTVDRKGERIAFWVAVKDDKGQTIRTTFVCSLATGLAHPLKCGGGEAVFAPDGKSVAVHEGPTVGLVDIKTGETRQTVRILPDGARNAVTSVAFSPDGKTLAVLAGDNKVYLRDAVTLESRRTWTVPGNDNNLRNVGWADDQTVVCRSFSREKALVVLNTDTGKLKHSYPREEMLKLLPLGKKNSDNYVNIQVIEGTTKVFVRTRNIAPNGWWVDVSFLFDWSSGKANNAYIHRSPFGCYATAVAPDLSIAVQGDGKLNDLLLWDPQNAKDVGRLRAAVRGADPLYTSIRWSPDGKGVAWLRIPDGKDRGHAELDLTTLTLANRKDEEFKTYPRSILREWESLTLKANYPNLEITGGPQPVKFPVWPNGPVDWDYTFVAGGRVVAEGWNSPVLQVFDSATGKRLHASRVVHSYILSLALSPDRRYVAIGSDDQTVTVYNPATGKVLLTVFPTGRNWIAWTPDGYYAATPGGERLMGWHVDNGPDQLASFYPAERFRKTLYRPDVIKLVLVKGSVEEALKAANTALAQQGEKIEEGVANVEQLLPPRVVLTRIAQKGNAVTIRIDAKSAGKKQPVTSLRLLVNSRPLPEGKCVKDYGNGKAEAKETWDVELPPGKHELKVLVRSPDAAELSNTIEESIPVPARDRPTLHALCIGVNKYQEDGLALKAAAPDADALTKALANSCCGGDNLFGAVKPTLLTDENATHAKILKALTAIRKDVRQQDLLVVFFAGHGVRDQKKSEFYLLPVDARTNRLDGTALSGTLLREKLSDMPCQVLFIMDACHSAAGIRAFKPATDDATRTFTDDTCGVVVLCAAMGQEFAIERAGRGLFTASLVKALQATENAPFNIHDRKQYLHHLYSFAFDEVQKDSQGRQHPFLSVPWITTSFAVRKLPEKGTAP